MKESRLYKAETKLKNAMKVDKKADKGVAANLKDAMKYCKSHMAECKHTPTKS
jgi:hypothetical protein